MGSVVGRASHAVLEGFRPDLSQPFVPVVSCPTVADGDRKSTKSVPRVRPFVDEAVFEA
jgi:hypothetical protein